MTSKRLPCLAGIGVEVATVLQIGCGEELQQVAGGAALGLNKAVDLWVAVVAYAPSGIPRQAEGGQWFAAQSASKPHLRGNAINFIDVLQQRNRIDVFCQKMGAVLLRQLGQIALFFAAQNIGMGFDPDIGLRGFHSRPSETSVQT